MKKIRLILLLGVLLLFLGITQSLSAQQTFVHPGIPFTQSDLDQLKVNITKEPWLSAYNAFKNDSRSQLSYAMQGPFATVTRAPNLNNTQWKNDMVVIHNLAFMYVFTGNEAYARKATDMLDAWAVTNTTWGGNESMLDIGDYVQFWATAAEILRYTYPGWTAANTQHVEKYFSEVLFPHSWVPYPLRDQNKGALQLKIALAASVFCNDVTRFNQSIEVFRMDAGGGLRNSLANGEVGDTGRDDHWRVQAAALAWGAEVAYKQKVDMFSELDNRLLAIGELYHKYAFDGASMTYIPFGGYASYWTNWGIQPGARFGDMTNLIYSAYAVRKGIPTPNTDRMRAALGGVGGDFLFLKSEDSSTAVSLPPVIYPADNVIPVSNLTSIDIGNTGLAGSTTFNNGIWTQKAAGTSTSNSFSFNFKKVSGDAGLIVKVENMSLSSGGCGLMFRESLAPGASFYDIYLNGNGGAGRHWQPKAPWWLKIERVGSRIFTYHSQDGTNWTNLNCYYSPTGFSNDLYAGFYTISNNTSALNTATFSNVAYSQTAPTGSPEISSATTVTTSIGESLSYSINASANPTSYNAVGLPAGLSLNQTTGIISGIATEIGQSEVTITTTNVNGSSTATLILKVINNQTPTAPTSAVASVINTTQIKLNWEASVNATSYSVKRSLTSGGPYTTIQTAITGTTFTDVNPVPEVSNYYVITALTGDKESGVSNEVFAAVPPAIPSNLTATNQSDRINLAWETASGAASYKVKRGTLSGGPYTTIATVSTNSYQDTNVTSASPYYYVVSSVGTSLESGNSAEVFGIPGANSSVWSPTPLSNVFNLSSNWVGNTLPINPAILTFKATTDSIVSNDINDLIVSRLQFSSDAEAYTISGNPFTLKNDLVNNSSSTQTLTTPLLLTDLLNVNTTGNTVLEGTISGNGSLMKSGSGILYIRGNNNFTGNSTLVSGIVSASGLGTGTPSNPTASPLGTAKIRLNGGALHATAGGDLNLYNDIEVLPGNRSYMYEDVNSITLRGKLLGNGTVEHDGNDYAGLNLQGDNSEFTGTFISKLRSGKQRIRFNVPEAGSAKATWLLDANAVDCHGIGFATGTLHFGALNGRGYIRANAGGAPLISIGALNTYSSYGGTIANFVNVEKVGTGVLEMWGNQAYGGTTTVKKGKLIINNNASTGVFISPIIIEEGALGGWGVTQSSATIGTGNGAGAVLEPGFFAVGNLSVGSLTLKADATYTPEINLGTAVGDKIKATDVNLLNSPVLAPINIAGTLASGTNYLIVDNTGTLPINGTFKNLPEMSLINIGGYDFRITYKGGTGNDVVLLDDRSIAVAITSSLEDTALNNRPYSYTITAIKSPSSFNATGLPNGLNIDNATGIISGSPTQTGAFTVSITATNGAGSDTKTLSLKVLNTIVEGVLVAAGDAKNIVEWNPIMNLSYNVKRSTTSGGPYTTIATVTESKYTDTNLTNGTSYYYVVSAIDNTGENPNSTEIKATPNIGQYSYFKFDESTGTRSIDSWGAQHGTLNTTASRSEGRNGQALKLDGTANSYATLPSGIVSTLSDFTISAWINMDELANWMRIFDFGTGTAKYMFLSAQAGVSGQVRFAIKNGGAEQGMTYNYTVPLKTWTHFAITQSGNICSMYINGTLVATNTAVTIKPLDLGSTNQNYLGKSQWNDPMFKGAIDEFKIYNRALTASEIAGSSISQTITFNPIAQKLMGEDDFDPLATASSGLPITYTSSDQSVATIVNGKIHILSTGTTTITASQPGNASYWPAASQTKVLTVAITNDTQLTTLIGKPFTYTITNKPLSNFTASGLAAGLSLDNTTGVISGIPTEYGSFPVVLTANNGNISGSQTIALTVQNNVPTNIIVAEGDGKNIIEWDPIADYSYNVKRSTVSGGPYTTIGNVSTTKFTDTNVTNGNTYYYVVSSIDGQKETVNSPEIAAVPTIGRVSYLKFDETSGTRAIDSWSAQHATLGTTASRDTGKYGSSLKLDGTTNAYATLANGIVSSLNDFTISTWIRMDVKTNWMRVFDFGVKPTSTVDPVQYMFLSIQGGKANVMRYAIKNGGAEQQVNYTYFVPINTWTHFAITQSGNTCSMYINGVLVATNTGVTIKPSALGITNQNYLGKSQFSGDALLKGSIDDFKIYSRALNATEIAETAKLNQSISLASTLQKEMGDADFSPATASSGLAISYTSSNTAVASIVDGKLHIVAPGNSTITASQSGNENYNSAQTKTQTLTVVKKDQTIDFAVIPAKSISDADFNAEAVASSGLAVTYSSSNTAVATIVDNKIHIIDAGSAVITASQEGNDIYNAATSVAKLLTVNKMYYVDADHDGFGTTSGALFAVNVAPEGYATNDTDCNDSDATVHQPIQYYVDADKDGFGSTVTAMLCSSVAPEGYATNNTDCNDNDATVYQPIQYYVDADKDGFGSNVTAMLCSSVASEGYATNNTDCNDSDAAIHEPVLYYVDADRDGLGSNVTAMLCTSVAPQGYATNNTDCDDTNAIQLTATIPDVYALNAAVDDKNTIYIGYGPTSLSISATPAGGTAPYTYQWSTNQTAKNISVSAAGTYTVIVTDVKGCQTTASIEIKTLNVQCGNSNDKVQICHNNNVICVAQSAVQAHLNHGDKLGSCSYISSKDISKTLSEENAIEDVSVYPNPVSSLLNVKVNEVQSGATLELYNSIGMKVLSQTLKSTSEEMQLDRLPSGTYLLKIINGATVTVKNIIKK